MDWIDFETGKVYDTYKELAEVRKDRECPSLNKLIRLYKEDEDLEEKWNTK